MKRASSLSVLSVGTVNVNALNTVCIDSFKMFSRFEMRPF